LNYVMVYEFFIYYFIAFNIFWVFKEKLENLLKKNGEKFIRIKKNQIFSSV